MVCDDEIRPGWSTKVGLVALALFHTLLQMAMHLGDAVWSLEGLSLQRVVVAAGSVGIVAFAIVTVAGARFRHHQVMVRWCTGVAWVGLALFFVSALQQTPYEWQSIKGPHGRGAYGPVLAWREGFETGVHLFVGLATWGIGLAAIRLRPVRWHLGWVSAVLLFAAMVAWWPEVPPRP